MQRFAKKLLLIMTFLCMSMQCTSLFCAKKKRRKKPKTPPHSVAESRANNQMKPLVKDLESLPALLEKAKLYEAKARTKFSWQGDELENKDLDTWMLTWQEHYDSIIKSKSDDKKEKLGNFENMYTALGHMPENAPHLSKLEKEKEMYEKFCKDQENNMCELKTLCITLARLLFRDDERIRMIKVIETFDLRIINTHKSIAEFVLATLYKLTHHVKKFSENNTKLKLLQEAGALKLQVKKVEIAKKETLAMGRVFELFKNISESLTALDEASKASELSSYAILFNAFKEGADSLTSRVKLLEKFIETLNAAREKILEHAQ